MALLKPAEAAPDRLLTADEVAALLSVSRRRVMDLMRTGALPSIRVSDRVVRFERQDVDAFLERRKRT